MKPRAIPSVEHVRQALGPQRLPPAVVVHLIRAALADLRRRPPPGRPPDILNLVRRRLDAVAQSRLQPVINGTGVIIHTNLGRAPLAASALARLAAVGPGYSNLEFDLDAGTRGDRSAYVELQLALLCRAEAATVVNNCAAALLLILRHLTQTEPRREVLISRGELVQIGGGFRIPEVLESAGATLREVGTTNRTTLADYARAISPATALILKVHRSNFAMEGFVESPSIADLAALARRHRRPLVEDLGSGALLELDRLAALPGEPTPAQSVRQGVDLVCFSGDKLLGGPQSGIIVGRRRWITAFKQEPLFRALRCDKLVLAALEATAEHYLAGDASDALPTLAMAKAPADTLQRRGETLLARLRAEPPFQPAGPYEVRLERSAARLGGGTLPAAELDSHALVFKARSGHSSLQDLAQALRQGTPPVVGTLNRNLLRLDLRTVLPSQDDSLLEALRRAAQGVRP